jgi:hypothetical protein
MRLRVDAQQLALVVEHLLEVRDQPVRVGAVAVKAPAELIVDAPASHAVQRENDLLERPRRCAVDRLGQEDRLQVRGRRKLGRAPEAAVGAVRLLHELPRQAAERLGSLGTLPLRRRTLAQRLEDPVGLTLDHVALLRPDLGHRLDHVAPARPTVRRSGREVGAAEERATVRGAEDVQRPSAGTREPHDRLHVDLVDVGPLLAVHLDADESLVHEPRRVRILERLPLHDVAPVARGVADRDQHRPALPPRALPGLFAPGVPVDRVVPVLEQVGAGLASQAVRHRSGQPRSGGVTASIQAA